MSEPFEPIPIGALSRMSGVPAETIRTWERRYGLLSPERDQRDRRVYAEVDVRRLQLVARLVEQGERVADLARMNDAQLEHRLLAYQDGPAAGLPAVLRAAVVHPTLAEVLAGPVHSVARRMTVVASSPTLRELHLDGTVDVLFLDLDTLGPDPLAAVDGALTRLAPSSVVLLYHYAPRSMRRALRARAVRLVAAPLPIAQIRQHGVDALLASGLRDAQPTSELRSIRFPRPQLERLMHRATALECECPNHLAELLLSLQQFEGYSRACAARDEDDAALHRDLADGTASARVVIEELLVRVCDHDGIEI